ncbi:hypothetical protein ACFPMF_02925 [Larkinella bovis]|uniref:Uncharacterized protein n=1 Tax=Larkinella bovis TaxID=683041 RepID=A0ABW0IAB4_9BACT
MKYLLPFLFLCWSRLPAQPTGTGLGPFVLGLTTPDSLRRFPGFQEQELVVVKGTLALPCTAIRVFKADTVQITGLLLSNLFLVFYENRLFRITVDYSESLQQNFVRQRGNGKAKPPERFSACDDAGNKPLMLSSERWQDGDTIALAVYAAGFNAHCRPEKTARFTLARQPVLAITSECDLDHLDPYFDALR